MAGFLRFCDEKIGLNSLLNRISGTRKRPVIPDSMIAKTVVVGADIGMESLRELDVTLRLPEMRKTLGSERPQVASDTTIARVVKEWEVEEVESIVRMVWRKGRTMGVVGKELGGEERSVGVIDRTTVGGRMRSVLVEVGKAVACMGMEAIPKRGKELPSSMKLLRAVARREGKGVRGASGRRRSLCL